MPVLPLLAQAVTLSLTLAQLPGESAPIAPLPPDPGPAGDGEPAPPPPPIPEPAGVPGRPLPEAARLPPRPVSGPAVVPLRERRYGDGGTSELALGLGYSSTAGFVGAGAFRYFVVDGVAPGLELTYVSGGTEGQRFGLVLASLRLVPVRAGNVALVLTGRGGRVMLAEHADGWGAGGAAGVIFFVAPGVGLELGYEALWLFPASFHADLSSDVIHGPVFGLRLAF